MSSGYETVKKKPRAASGRPASGRWCLSETISPDSGIELRNVLACELQRSEASPTVPRLRQKDACKYQVHDGDFGNASVGLWQCQCRGVSVLVRMRSGEFRDAVERFSLGVRAWMAISPFSFMLSSRMKEELEKNAELGELSL